MPVITRILQDCQLSELIQIAWHLEEYENCRFVRPVNVHSCNDWIFAVKQMIMQKQIRSRVRFITDIKERIRINMRLERAELVDIDDVTVPEVIIELVDDPQPTEAEINDETEMIIIDEEITDETRILECKICTVYKICMVLSGCGHTFCHSCTTRFDGRCATCRTPFTDDTKIRIYI